MEKYQLSLVVFFMVSFPFIFFSQQEGNNFNGLISGKIVDMDSQNPLDYATITIFSQGDSSLVTGDLSKKDGRFSFQVPFGNHFAKVEFIGFKPKIINDIFIGQENSKLVLGTIQLEINSENLSEVEVRADKSTYQLSLDKRVFNVGKDIANAGGTAADILNDVPSVAVDVDGTVSLRGNESVQILVDGKPSGLVGLNNSNGLKNLPAHLIDKVEVITNPSSKFEAEGTAGILNIILKKEKKGGLNGSLDLLIGHPSVYGSAINLNFRKNQFNFFTNLSYDHWSNIGGGNVYQEFFGDNDTTEIFTSERQHKHTAISKSFRFGADYHFNKNTIFTPSFSYPRSQEDNLNELEYFNFINNLNNEIGESFRTDQEQEEDRNLEYVLSYKRMLGKKGHQIVADIRIQKNEEEEDSEILEQFFEGNNLVFAKPELKQRSSNQGGEQRFISKIDYTLPLGKNQKIEAGYQSSFRKINNNYLVEELNNQDWELYHDVKSRFKYKENIHAFYSSYANKINKFSFQFGLRLEYTDVITELLESNKLNPRSYFNFFPSTHLTYNFSEKNAIQLSYSRRLKRPRFGDLNPSFSFSDTRNRFLGNPDLNPEYTNSYEVGHIRFWEKGSLGSSIFYRNTVSSIEGVFYKVEVIDSIPVAFRRPENFASKDDFGFEFNFSFQPLKWWKINGDAYFFRAITDGSNLDEDFSADTYIAIGRLTSRLTFFKKIDLQMRLNYRAPQNKPQGTRKSISFLNIGMSRKFLKKKGTMTLSISDVFNSFRSRGTLVTDRINRSDEFRWRSRSVRLSFGYRLNQKKS
ncbi:MAG: TonB-dependent receptor [Saprospiraceae bacterium]